MITARTRSISAELKDAGVHIAQLANAGFHIVEFKDAGFDAWLVELLGSRGVQTAGIHIVQRANARLHIVVLKMLDLTWITVTYFSPVI